MRLKVKYLIIPLLLILGLLGSLSLVYSKDSNLRCDVASIITRTKDEIPTVKLVFQYEWLATPIRLSKDTFKIRWSDGWEVQRFSVTINNEDKTDIFYEGVNNNSENEIILQLDSNQNVFSKEFCQGEIILIPENLTKLSNSIYSESSIQYFHKSLFKKVVKSNSVGWKNEIVLFKN